MRRGPEREPIPGDPVRVADEDPRLAAGAMPDRRLGEHGTAAGRPGGRDLPAEVAARGMLPAVQPVEVEQPEHAVLAALEDEVLREDRGSGAAQVEVGEQEPLLVARRVALERLQRRRELEHAVAPLRAAVPEAVGGRDEQVPGGIDGGGDPSPDAAVGSGAARRADDRRAVTAEDVEDARRPGPSSARSRRGARREDRCRRSSRSARRALPARTARTPGATRRSSPSSGRTSP